MIVDPSTGRTQRHTNLLNTLVDWTTRDAILYAMLRAGLANLEGLMDLVKCVKLTLDGEDALPEIEAARAILGFLAHPDVRRTIAKHIHQRHGETYRSAVRQLNELGDELEKEVLAARPGVRPQ